MELFDLVGRFQLDLERRPLTADVLPDFAQYVSSELRQPLNESYLRYDKRSRGGSVTPRLRRHGNRPYDVIGHHLDQHSASKCGDGDRRRTSRSPDDAEVR